jgi:hypothetical protein
LLNLTCYVIDKKALFCQLTKNFPQALKAKCMAGLQNSLQKPKRRARSSSRYKRSETFRLVKGAQDAGLTVRGLEVDPATGVLRVLVGGGAEAVTNPWDEVLPDAADKKRSA